MANNKKTDREKAMELYLQSNGIMPLIDIAKKLGRPPGTVRGWKSKDNWDERLSGAFQEETNRSTKKRNVPKKERPTRKDPKPKMDLQILEELEDADLTDMQRLFCLHYIRTFNRTQSAIKAGYAPDSAHVQGSRLLSNDKIKREIRKLKAEMRSELFIDAMDVLEQYAKIAFADITEFVDFDTELVPVMSAHGPVIMTNPATGKQEPLLKEVNVVKFKGSRMVDGQLISEVKQGRDGASIKLMDKMRALEKLEQYFDVIPDEWKRKIDEEKLAIDRAKLELDRLKITGDGQGSDQEAINDFIKATTVPVDEVANLFADESGDDDVEDDLEGDSDEAE